MTRINKRALLLVLSVWFVTLSAYTQENGEMKTKFAPINTAVPALSIAPDARGGSMGDNGVSTLPDVNSQYWNAAKYPFMGSKAGISLSYTPWLRKLVTDVALANLVGFYKLGDDEIQAISASLRYFTLGELQGNLTGNPQENPIITNPYDVAFDIGYSRKLSENYSMAVALRYIRSEMSDGTDERVPGNAYAADVSGYMEKYVMLGNAEAIWSLGYNFANMGTKISYDGDETSHFLPTKMTIGTGLLYPLDEYNRIGFYFDLSKFMVPTLPKGEGMNDEEAAEYERLKQEYNSMSAITGIIKSFGDAPGGFSEEMKEVMISFGAEYSYNEQFFIRGGYYYENPMKGNRQYFTAGAGFRMNVFEIDAAYLISTAQNNPLDQTLRFTLSFDMDGIKNLFK